MKAASTDRMNDPAPLLDIAGVRFRDLDHDGRMSPYEDPRLPADERAADLLSRMTVEEKAGLLFHAPLAVGQDGSLVERPSGLMPTAPTTSSITGHHIRHFNLASPVAAGPLARWQNRVQDLAASSRLGIPALISTDPRHSAVGNPLTSVTSGGFSSWPEPLGFGALADESMVREFGDIARREYLAVGLRMAIHPMADIASDPRWTRTAGTFGADPDVVARLTAAYVEAFQGPRLDGNSVACLVKHWPGAGPQKDGEDSHFPSGKEQVYPTGRFEQHRAAFRPALRAGAAAVMPYYGMPVGVPGLAEMGFAFNPAVVDGMLRAGEGFDGVVCTDWGLLTDDTLSNGAVWPARAWGAEHLTPAERALMLLNAGVDQFGGETCTDVVIALHAEGLLSTERLDRSATRILRVLFQLGLFEDPYVDEDRAMGVAGAQEFVKAGAAAQRAVMTLLTNRSGPDGIPVLPLRSGLRLYIEGVDPAEAAKHANLVPRPEDAEAALIRIAAPYDPRPQPPESFFHQGRLDLPEEQLAHLLSVARTVPTVVDVFLERGAVIPELAEHAAALLVDFAADDGAVLEVVFGHAVPRGRLPIELPRSMAAVRAHPEDQPGGSEDPLFPIGHAEPAVQWMPRDGGHPTPRSPQSRC